ncbi:LCP family protein [Peptostreptococcus sp. D1]|uniref:LCP family protein n=1 Tax=Peptostreptococcus sp. D1 TaxID=72304 RepID=UPI0008E394DC|nr:LCP family protein [Peptostreptococcus sp. D1]SFE18586.1 transcriptional attenuator, LytR family [Peptostreptococcus sp. D1]
MKRLKQLMIILLLVLLATPLAIFGLSVSYLSKINSSNIDTGSLEKHSYAHKDGIKNILILGSDARPGENASRTDSMMILTIDNVNDSLKITSLARDAFVNIPGYGYSKLTHAYAYGKEKLLIDTIESNFEIDLDDVVLINFQSFISIIDAIGGVTVNVTEDEMTEMNKFIPETYKWSENPDKGEMTLITRVGSQKLNGYQALSFARIRKNDSAFGRDNRQRMIVSNLLKEIKNTSKLKYPFLIKAAAPYISTNMSTTKMIKYSIDVLRIGTGSIKQMEFPIVSSEKYSTGGIYGSYGWVLRFEPESIKILKSFIFNDVQFDESKN